MTDSKTVERGTPDSTDIYGLSPAKFDKAALENSKGKEKVQFKKQAIVVLAMHRTGSSALTRVLNLLGCSVAKTLIGPNEHNESGYWESDILRVFNDQILDSAGTDWRDWHPFNSQWYASKAPEQFLNRGTYLLKDEFGDSDFFTIKDPRMGRIFPFWRRLFYINNIEPRVILTLRHPFSVGKSLEKRDKITATESALIWLRNVIDSEYGSRGCIRCVVDYDHLLETPRETLTIAQDRLDLIWPRFSEKVGHEIEAFITPKLRHHGTPQSEFSGIYPFKIWLQEVYQIMQRWSDSGENQADYHVLDDIRKNLGVLSGPLSYTINNMITSAATEKKNEEKITILKNDLETFQKSITNLKAENDELKNSIKIENDANTENSKKLICITKEIEDLKAALNNTTEEGNIKTSLIKRLEDELAIARGYLAQYSQGINKASEQLGNAVDEVAMAQAKVATLQNDHAQDISNLSEENRKLSLITEGIQRLDRKIKTQSRDLANISLLLIDSEGRLEQQNGKLNEKINNINNEMRKKDHSLTAANQRIEDLLNSTSWRITAPMRRFSRALKKIPR